MKHSIATVSLSGSLIDKVKAIAKAGYDGFEIFENDLTVSDLSPSTLKKIASDFGLEIIGLQPFRDFEAMPQPYKLRGLERAKHKFDLMHQLGTKKLFVCSNTSIHAIDSLEKAAEDLFDLAEMAKQHGFEVGYEALSWGKHVNTYHQSIEIVRLANHSNLGNILDNFHISALNSTFEDIYTIPKDKITVVQVADSLHHDMSAIHIARHLRCFPGQGTYPVIEFVKAIQSTGYDGYLSHEIFNDEFRASGIEPVALDGKRSLIWLDNQCSQTLAKPHDLTAIAFIAFASTAQDQTHLLALLHNIGFVETRRHQYKKLSLFELGQVKLLINNEIEVPPHAINQVAALGFVNKNNESLRNWAKSLSYDWQEDNTTNQALDLATLKGIDGLTYYFVEENQLEILFEDADFIPTNLPKNDNGIIGIDHLGHCVNGELSMANTLFYRAMLGLDIEESLEIFDPRGIVYSRVAKNRMGTIKIPLSSTKSLGTATESFLSKSGAGIQQIALASQDIFRSAQFIEDKKMILQIPANYYVDLRAKTQLSDEQIEKMKTFNILYDRQEEGEFLHFYFKALNGLFVEIVQRKGFYNRYGEINAQVRLAAQARDR